MLTQVDADALLEMEKHRVDEKLWAYPQAGESINVPLVSANKREKFHLDIRRHRITLVSGTTYQLRARVVEAIARIDFARSHRNPDGEEIPAPHLHVYVEGFDLKWAYPLDVARFGDGTDRMLLLTKFMEYIHLTRQPNIQPDFFA